MNPMKPSLPIEIPKLGLRSCVLVHCRLQPVVGEQIKNDKRFGQKCGFAGGLFLF